MRGAKSASHITQSHLSAKNHSNLIDIPQTNYYQMILRIIWSNAQVIPLLEEWELWCYVPLFLILGVLVRIFFRKIYLQFMLCIVEGLLLDIVKIELAVNKVLRNDLAAPRSGALATWSSERPYFCPIVLEATNGPSIHKLDCSLFF